MQHGDLKHLEYTQSCRLHCGGTFGGAHTSQQLTGPFQIGHTDSWLQEMVLYKLYYIKKKIWEGNNIPVSSRYIEENKGELSFPATLSMVKHFRYIFIHFVVWFKLFCFRAQTNLPANFKIRVPLFGCCLSF